MSMANYFSLCLSKIVFILHSLSRPSVSFHKHNCVKSAVLFHYYCIINIAWLKPKLYLATYFKRKANTFIFKISYPRYRTHHYGLFYIICICMRIFLHKYVLYGRCWSSCSITAVMISTGSCSENDDKHLLLCFVLSLMITNPHFLGLVVWETYGRGCGFLDPRPIVKPERTTCVQQLNILFAI